MVEGGIGEERMVEWGMVVRSMVHGEWGNG
jgi:hypothetical protein